MHLLSATNLINKKDPLDLISVHSKQLSGKTILHPNPAIFQKDWKQKIQCDLKNRNVSFLES